MNQSIPGNGKARISSSKISKIPRSIPTLPLIKNVPSITNTIIPHHCLRSEIYKFADIQDQRMRSKRGAWNLRLSLYKMVARGATQQSFIRRGSVRRMSNPLLPFHIPFLAETAVYGEERCVTILKRPRGRLLFEQNLNV